MKRIFVVLGCLCAFVCMVAQPRFVAERDITKVGELQFQVPKTFTLGFINKGDKPLKILNVQPSCGCTTAEYSQAEIAPNERGEIKVTFDAKMLGTFYKDFEIHTNAGQEPVYMALQGIVVKEVKDYSADFPIDLGNVRLISNYVEFDDVNRGDYPEQIIRVMNTDRTAYKPELMHLPPYLTAICEPENIPGGKAGIIRLRLDSKKLFQLGLNQTSVYLARYMGDKVSEENEIVVSAVLLPDFSNLTADQLDQAPELTLSEEELDFGSMGDKRKLTRKLVITNTGKSTLNIRQVQVFNRSLSVSLGNRTLAPGKSTKLKVTVNAKHMKKAKARPRVLLISDDPKHPKTIVNVHVTE